MELFNHILKTLKGDYVDIFWEEKTANQIQMEENKVQKCSTVFDNGLGVRLIIDGKTFYAYTNDLTKRGIDELLSSLKNYRHSECIINLKKVFPSTQFVIKKNPQDVEIAEKIKFVKRANDISWTQSKKIKQVKVLYGETFQKIKIANSEQYFTEEERVHTLFLIHAVASEDGVIQTGYEAYGGLKGLELFDEISPETLANAATQRALMMLNARKIKGGRMPVVISSKAGGTIIHEAVGHGLEADLVQEGLSVYSGKLGEKIASEIITVIDDSTLPNMRGSYLFDDEGTPSQKTVLIHEGILTNYLYDKYAAMNDGKASTGNGRRQSYEHYPIPRMSNTLIAPGNHSPEEIIRSVDKGFFVNKMGGGQVNTVTGEFVFEVQEGYLIENGQISEPVRGVLLIGTGQEILKNIDMVGNDLGFSIGTCGKNSQGVPVTDGIPTVRIPEIVIGGEIQ
ncbi:TldD/PmbA family protein [Thermodesulfovibrio thiophilus]|uniref:TldD/PmbA family protein n=1 Tax=Thermodesulfovibrio thiophilus TaxID=340095 RepID=UPI0017E5E819|nr:TldD/PmbA family protein [Thermodesulfovibrio thiophilus]HHW19724.1 TldD/PmbA family protein [Thermodesulfovibrio thiophilus]